MSAAVDRWRQVLDQIRANLESDRAAFIRGDVVAPRLPWRPPNMPELPAVLADEATELLREHNELVAEITDRLAQLQPPRSDRPASRTPGRFEIVA